MSMITPIFVDIALALLVLSGHCVLATTVGFWHFTDFHYDPFYDSQNGFPSQYCHFVNNSVGQRLGQYGDERCDNPWVLMQSAVAAMKQLHPDAAFLIYTGDSAPHVADKDTNMTNVIRIITDLNTLVVGTFPGVPLYSVLGNHDYHPTDQLPPDDYNNELYQTVAELWQPYISYQSANTVRQYGYYSTQLDGLWSRNFVIIGLNTNTFYAPNLLIRNESDPGGQFAFLETELKKARSKKLKVWLIGHVQPGMRWPRQYQMTDQNNDKFYQLLVEYADTIQAMHFGHTHKDTFMLIRKNNQDPGSASGAVNWLLTAPAVNTWLGGGRNPAVKYFDVDAMTGELRRIRAYYMNISAANANNQSKPVWMLEYDQNITSTALDYFVGLYNSIRSNRTAFDQYLGRVNVQSAQNACNDTCRRQELCDITETDYDKYDRCMAGVSSYGVYPPSLVMNFLPLFVLALLVMQ